MLLVYNQGRQEAITVIGGNFRYNEHQSFRLPSAFSDEEVHCYIAFQNAGKSAVSDSQYLGRLIVE